MTGFLLVVMSPDVQTNAAAINGASHWGVIVFNEGTGQILKVIENGADTSGGGANFTGFRYGHPGPTRAAGFIRANLPVPGAGATYAVNNRNNEYFSYAGPAHTGQGRAVFYWTRAGAAPTDEWLNQFHTNFTPLENENNPCGRAMAAFYNAWITAGPNAPAVPATGTLAAGAFSTAAYTTLRGNLLNTANCA